MLTFTAAIEQVGKAEAKVDKRAPVDVGAPITPIKGSEVPPGVTRSECALTGDPIVDAVIMGPVTRRNIDYPVIDRSWDVPYGSGGSEPLEDPTTFVDEHVPKTLTVGDVTFDPAEPWLVHENVEQSVMEKLIVLGWTDEEAYRVAHFCFAEVAEHAWYRAHGIDPAAAEDIERPWLDEIDHENPVHPPPNLYVKPYPHSDVTLAQNEPVEEAKPSDDEIDRGRALVAAIYEVASVSKIEDETPSYELRRALHDYLHKNASPQVAAIVAPEVAARMEKQAMEVLDDRVREALRKQWAGDGPNALALFEKILDRISKLQPSASDVHATTALGNDKKGKRKNFKAFLAERKQKTNGYDVDKSADGEPWEVEVIVTKAEDVGDQHLVFGFASMAEMDGKLIVDKQGDMIEPEELEKAAYEYVLYHRRLGDMHERIGVGDMVESMVFTKQKQDLLGIDLGIQGWWVGFFVTDEGLWKRIKAGEMPEFSIAGRALRVPIE